MGTRVPLCLQSLQARCKVDGSWTCRDRTSVSFLEGRSHPRLPIGHDTLVSLLSLAEDLRKFQPGLLQPWYAGDFSIYGRASQVASLFNRLCAKGPSIGYFPAPAKSWAICPKRMESNAKAILGAAGLPVRWSRGQRYVGGFVGSSKMQEAMVATNGTEVGQWGGAACKGGNEVPSVCLCWLGKLPPS
eukprot:CCRYP_009733-RA/>CCRYP_009733-RA protein AED:0.50 eAED:0.50 QI:0/-1/0/1/-1/0/1/0/187